MGVVSLNKLALLLMAAALLVSGCTTIDDLREGIKEETKSPVEKCRDMCSASKMIVQRIEKDMCYCIEPRQNVTLNPLWRCFNSMNTEKNVNYAEKFNSTSARPVALSALLPYNDVGDDAMKVFAIYNAVAGKVKYVPDPYGEDYIGSPQEIWDSAAGDCDDYAVLLSSMYEAIGFDAYIVYPFTESKQEAHAYVMLKMQQNISGFIAGYEKILTQFTNYSGIVPFNIMLFAGNGTGCHELAAMASAGNLTGWWLQVEGTSRDYAGAHDSMQGFDDVRFFEVGN
jgi:predicted transglutaminase-like cysteine proteinase